MQVDLPQAQVSKEDDGWKGRSASWPEGLLAPGGLIVVEPFELQPVPHSRLRVSRAAVGASQCSLAFPEANARQREWSEGEVLTLVPRRWATCADVSRGLQCFPGIISAK